MMNDNDDDKPSSFFSSLLLRALEGASRTSPRKTNQTYKQRSQTKNLKQIRGKEKKKLRFMKLT